MESACRWATAQNLLMEAGEAGALGLLALGHAVLGCRMQKGNARTPRKLRLLLCPDVVRFLKSMTALGKPNSQHISEYLLVI